MWLPRVRGSAQPVRRALLPRGDPVHHLRPRGRVSASVGRQAEGNGLGRVDHDDGVPGRAVDWLRLRLEERGVGLGMSTLVNSAGQPLAPAPNTGGAVTAPDQTFFKDLNQE